MQDIRWRHGGLHVMAAVTVLLTGCGASLNSDGPVALGSDPLSQAPPGASSTLPSADSGQLSGAQTGTIPRSESTATTPKAVTSSAAGYKIGPQDVLDISVFKVPELSKTIQVSDSGTINLPLVGEVQAAGRTSQEVEKELTQKLGAKYLQSPQVTVFVKEFNSQRITIDGAVTKPGVFPYRNSITLLQAVTMAGGLDKNSDSTVVVFRTTNGQRKGARFDISEIRDGQGADPAIEPGDVVIVGTSAVKEAFNNVLKALPVAGLFMGL